MCGRFTLDVDERFYPRFRLGANVIKIPPEYIKRYNISPSQQSLVITKGDEQASNKLATMRWGFLPFWVSSIKEAGNIINAKSETVLEKPAFRKSIQTKRCIVPVNGFYEWTVQADNKQPYYFYSKTNQYLALAGIYNEWADKATGEIISSFAILTTKPNSDFQKYHDRMPLILEDSDEEKLWLEVNSKDNSGITNLLQKKIRLELASTKVTKAVNNPHFHLTELLTA